MPPIDNSLSAMRSHSASYLAGPRSLRGHGSAFESGDRVGDGDPRLDGPPRRRPKRTHGCCSWSESPCQDGCENLKGLARRALVLLSPQRTQRAERENEFSRRAQRSLSPEKSFISAHLAFSARESRMYLAKIAKIAKVRGSSPLRTWRSLRETSEESRGGRRDRSEKSIAEMLRLDFRLLPQRSQRVENNFSQRTQRAQRST